MSQMPHLASILQSKMFVNILFLSSLIKILLAEFAFNLFRDIDIWLEEKEYFNLHFEDIPKENLSLIEGCRKEIKEDEFNYCFEEKYLDNGYCCKLWTVIDCELELAIKFCGNEETRSYKGFTDALVQRFEVDRCFNHLKNNLSGCFDERDGNKLILSESAAFLCFQAATKEYKKYNPTEDLGGRCCYIDWTLRNIQEKAVEVCDAYQIKQINEWLDATKNMFYYWYCRGFYVYDNTTGNEVINSEVCSLVTASTEMKPITPNKIVTNDYTNYTKTYPNYFEYEDEDENEEKSKNAQVDEKSKEKMSNGVSILVAFIIIVMANLTIGVIVCAAVVVYRNEKVYRNEEEAF